MLNFRLFNRLFYLLTKVKLFFSFPDITSYSNFAKIIWLIKLRWILISIYSLLCIAGYINWNLTPSALILSMGLLGLFGIFNLFTYLIFVLNPKPVTPLFLGFQLIIDALVFTILITISGGLSNPFISLYLFFSALGALLLNSYYAWSFQVLLHGLVCMHQLAYIRYTDTLSDSPRWDSIFGSHLSMILIWLALRSLGNFMEGSFQKFSQSQIHTAKQERLRAIGALAAGFSHEFSSPLNVAKIQMNRLQRLLCFDKVDEIREKNTNESLELIMQSLVKCESVLLAMNSSQLDFRNQVLKSIHLQTFISEITNAWRIDQPTSKLNLVLSETGYITVSALNFAQVLINLLDNAFQANPSGETYVTLARKLTNYYVTIENEGSKFSSFVLEKQGEPFVTTRTNGTGLGLYVAQLFADNCGGTLEVSNSLKGARVTLCIPVEETNS